VLFVATLSVAACSRPIDEPAPTALASSSASAPSASGSAIGVEPALLLSAEVALPSDALRAPSAMALGTTSAAPASPATNSGLPADAPKQVVFGVALVAYRGAQGAAASARSRDDALALAERIATRGADDFADAVKSADVGFENAGAMPRGVLEATAEQALFGLEVGKVSKPVDSPRGYYVFKRLQ
jgi:hypothetical protein